MAAEDIRVLVPRVRRAVEGVGAPAVLTDDQVKDLIADAIADVILFTGGVFGKELQVIERDATTNAPTEYATSEPLTLSEGSVIAAQAALQHIFMTLRELKVQEAIRDEGAEWSYTLSAQAIRDWLKYLQSARDQAIAEIEAQQAMPTFYVNLLHERDRLTDQLVEPYFLGLSP